MEVAPEVETLAEGMSSASLSPQSKDDRNHSQSSCPVRPFDTLGPPSTPIPFPPHRFEWGRRDTVCCVDPATQEVDQKDNVLFRDYSREFPDDGESRVRVAYWPVPSKRPIKTIMGHVEICWVLERSNARENENEMRDDDDGDDDTDTDDDDGDCDEEDDVVFVMTQRRVAIKVNYYNTMERLRGRHAEDPLKEIAAMQLIGNKHPHVLGCDEVLFDGKNLNVVMRYCERGDLFQLLQESQLQDVPGMTEARARFWFRQLVSGLHFLHRRAGICHRDLSPENVMIDDRGCMIIDMGMCLRVPYIDSQGNKTDISKGLKRCLFKPQGACGKASYMSPEIFANRANWDGEAVDIFTSGTILFCMVTGNRSYQHPHASDAQFYWMTHGLSQLLADWGIKLSPEGLALLKGMLTISPRDRLTLDEVANHPWFSYPDDPA